MLYENLPGIQLTVKDGNLVLPAEDLGTRRVLIIAPTSEVMIDDTMDIKPKLVKSSEDFEANFGLFSKTNPLARLWKQAFDAGCRSIYLLELKGLDVGAIYENLHEAYEVFEDGFDTDIIVLGGVYADSDFSAATIDLSTSVKPDYVDPKEVSEEFLGETTPLTEVTLANTVVNEVISVVHDDGAVTTTLVADTDYTVAGNVITLINANDIADGETLTVTYTTTEHSFAGQLAGFCAEASSKYSQTIGVIGMTVDEDISSNDLSAIKTYVDGQGSQIYNQYLQVVGGAPVYFEINNEVYVDNFAGAYAGMISVLASYSSPTNKVIPGAIFPVFNLSPSQIQKLTNVNHIVVPRYRNGSLVVADAITTAPETSDFTRLTTLRITNDVVGLVREIGEPYIGEPNTLARRNALETAIRSSLNNMIKRGALNDFRFNIKSSVADQIEGNMLIFLDIVPTFETRRINVTVALKPTLE